MQNALDTFYVMLRDRVAAGNPARTMVVRGTVRPGVLVVENELVVASGDGLAMLEVFCLHWKSVAVDAEGPLPMVTVSCEIRYGTAGSASAAGMDRGRALAAMDGELLHVLRASPQTIVTMNYTSGTAVAMATNLFWGDPVFGAAVVKDERLERTVAVAIYSYQEAGEV